MRKPDLKKELKRVSTKLDRMAGHLEDNRFTSHQLRLDEANDIIEEVLEDLESL